MGKERRVRPALVGLRWWRCTEEVWSSWTDSLGLMVASSGKGEAITDYRLQVIG